MVMECDFLSGMKSNLFQAKILISAIFVPEIY